MVLADFKDKTPDHTMDCRTKWTLELLFCILISVKIFAVTAALHLTNM